MTGSTFAVLLVYLLHLVKDPIVRNCFFVMWSSVCEGTNFTKGEAGLSLQCLTVPIKSSIPDSQHTKVTLCYFSWSASMVDLFHLVWRSHQILFKKTDWVASIQHARQELWWISRSGRLLCFASIPIRNGENSCCPGEVEQRSDCFLMKSEAAQRSNVWPQVGRYHWLIQVFLRWYNHGWPWIMNRKRIY